MKYTLNGSTVALNKDILSEESLNTMCKEIDSSYNSCSKAIEAYNLVSNVKAMESFGYKATEGLGESIKNGAKAVWEKIKDVFRKIVEFFKRIFQSKKIENNIKKARIIKQNINSLKRYSYNGIALDYNTKQEKFKMLSLTYKVLNDKDNFIFKIRKFEKELDSIKNDLGECSEAIRNMDKMKYDPELIKNNIKKTIDRIDGFIKSFNLDLDFNDGTSRVDVSLSEFTSLYVNNENLFTEIEKLINDFSHNFHTISMYTDNVFDSMKDYDEPGINKSMTDVFSSFGNVIAKETKTILNSSDTIRILLNHMFKELTDLHEIYAYTPNKK